MLGTECSALCTQHSALKFKQGQPDPFNPFFDLLHRGRIGDADVVIMAKITSRNQGNVRLIQQVSRHFGRIADDLFLGTDFKSVPTPVIGCNIGEDVEGLPGVETGDPGNGRQALDNDIP